MCRPERTLVQEGGVALHQVGASVQAFLHVLGGGHAADGDDGQVVADFALEQAQHLEGAGLQRRAGEAAGTDFLDLGHIAGQAQAFAGDGGVGGDDAVQLQLLGQGRHLDDVLVDQVGCDLDGEGYVAVGADAVCLLAHGGEQRAQRLDSLQGAQTRSVRGGDVDDQVVCLRCQGAGRDQVVLDSVLELNDLGLADVHADNRAYDAAVFGFEVCAGGGYARACRCGTVIVEAHAVDDRLIFHEAEEARLRVAGLRLTGNGTDLDVAEADTSQRGNALAALVEARGQAEGRGEGDAHDGGCQFGGGLEVLAQRAGDADVAQGLHAPEADVVCLLGVHALEEDVEEGRVDAHLFSLVLEVWVVCGRRTGSSRWGANAWA